MHRLAYAGADQLQHFCCDHQINQRKNE
ncbi:hypothetical protein RO1_09230 [Roseburia intestinalis XB6B4]|uniref:Uncharacterized protein n=1 Tax=Roseburia intestinalis XB6B4 TaxID=718255 RepID=D4KW61_9FIRM|nr:hypothetical protein RO1_09230 [Roseburia intestinalis XB6B4]